MPIYTRTGDTGETSLFGGKRVSKSHELVEAYGSVDELNSLVGLIVAQIVHHTTLRGFLLTIQSDLFVIGGFLAGWESDLSGVKARVTEMEVEIDAMEEKLPQLTNFILPGGSPLGAQIHVTRSVCRRVERSVVSILRQSDSQTVRQSDQEIIIQYLNRLSDLFFVLARFINREAFVEEIPWVGMRREKRKK